MKRLNLLKHYTSEVDELLQAFDKEHPELSSSQKKEIAKFDRVSGLRDHVSAKPKTEDPFRE
jgi:hypothetical protein